jgi:hypothetical protein
MEQAAQLHKEIQAVLLVMDSLVAMLNGIRNILAVVAVVLEQLVQLEHLRVDYLMAALVAHIAFQEHQHFMQVVVAAVQ